MKTLPCAAAIVLLAGGAFAKPGTATTTVNLRIEANTTSEILTKIPGGSRLDVGECTEGWCAVVFQGRNGFAIATALDTTGRIARRAPVRRGPPRGYGPDDDFEPVARPYGPRVYGMPPPPPMMMYGPGPYWGPYGAYGPYLGPRRAYGPYWGPRRAYYGPYWGPRWGWGRW